MLSMKVELNDGKFVLIDWAHLRRPSKEFRVATTLTIEGKREVVMLNDEPLYRLVATPKTKGGTTRCNIAIMSKETEVNLSTGTEEASEFTCVATSVGEVKCDKKDNYSRLMGRKKSLSKALDVIPLHGSRENQTNILNKHERNLIWDRLLNPNDTPIRVKPIMELTPAGLEVIAHNA